MKQKLFFFQPFIGPYRIDFTNDLCRVFDARIYLKYTASEGQAFQQREILGQLHYNPVYLPGHSVYKLIKALRKDVSSYNPDIVISFEYDIITLFFLIWRKLSGRRYKLVGMSDDSYHMLTGHDFTWKHKVARWLLAKHLDDIILVEPRAVDWYRKKYGKGFFFPIIRNEEVVRSLYQVAVPLIGETRARYDLNGRHVYLYVGRLVAVKNLATLIAAFSRLDQSDNKLVIVGEGPEMNDLQFRAKEIGVDVSFVGRKDGPSLHVWYLIADTLVLPSLIEPFGAVVNEALVAGCNVVLSRNAGAGCLVKDGYNGYLINPDSVDDLQLKLEQSKQLGHAWASNSELRDSKMIHEYKELFQRLCEMLNAK